MRNFFILITFVTFTTLGVSKCQAGFIFRSTTDASSWEAAVKLESGSIDGTFISLTDFPTTGFNTASSISRFSDGVQWIANNNSGNNGGFRPVLYVYRQTFDLTGFDPTTANLQFQWAADDSGQGFALRGTWTPKYSLNGGALVDGVWPGGVSYDFGTEIATISSGFVNGTNTLSFYVEGNGVTDGFALRTISATADPAGGGTPNVVPAPAGAVLLLSGLGFFGTLAGLKKRSAHSRG